MREPVEQQHNHLGCLKHVPVQASVTPLPELEKPGLQVQPVEPAVLVLPAGHTVQDVAPAVGLYVLLGQTGCTYVHQRQRADWVRAM